MICITLETTDPFFNLAIEEVLLKNYNEEYLILGINSPSVVIGKHQVPHREVNTKFVTENKLPVIRRISGGGTVYHDLGNLNFTFIRQSEPGKQVDFRKYTLPVIEYLSATGIKARLEGKSDIRVGEYKISGNAEHVYRNRVLHHGTLLFNTSIENLGNSIRKDVSAYSSRAVESNPSTVANLTDISAAYGTIQEFRSALMEFLMNRFNVNGPDHISQATSEQAQLLANSKYRTWKWNWAYGPEYTFNKTYIQHGRHISLSVFVKDGIICTCSIDGSDKLLPVAKNLVGCRHMVDDLLKVLKEYD
jgi:lipoate-protein ligase A